MHMLQIIPSRFTVIVSSTNTIHRYLAVHSVIRALVAASILMSSLTTAQTVMYSIHNSVSAFSLVSIIVWTVTMTFAQMTIFATASTLNDHI
ncbi:hypothetical protein BDF14DRAFT_1761100 [Spinellus fusiger]|nr:hypothetical protein BDF14DRAFT_1761100 [Spinellus fusiger]